MLSAASCNKWWMDDIIGTKDYAKEQEKITALGDNHVFFLPYLMGERSPHNLSLIHISERIWKGSSNIAGRIGLHINNSTVLFFWN